MAKKKFDIDLNVNGQTDLNQLKQSLSQVASTVNELEQKKEALEEAFKSVEFATKEYKLLANELQNVNSKLANIDESVTDITSAEKVEGFLKVGGAITAIGGSISTVSAAFGENSEAVDKATQKIGAFLVILETLQLVTEALGKENKLFTQFLARNTATIATNTTALEGNVIANTATAASTSKLGNAFGFITKIGKGWVGIVLAIIAVLVIVTKNIDTLTSGFDKLIKVLGESFNKFTDFIGLTTKLGRETEKLVEKLRELEEIQKLVYSNDLLRRQKEFLQGKVNDIQNVKNEIVENEKRLKTEEELAKAERDKFTNAKDTQTLLDKIKATRVADAALELRIQKQKDAVDKLNKNQIIFIDGLEKELIENAKIRKDLQKDLALAQKDALEAENKALTTSNELQEKKNTLIEKEVDLRNAIREGIQDTLDFEIESLEEIDILAKGGLQKRIELTTKLFDIQKAGLADQLKNLNLEQAERVRINNQIISLERQKQNQLENINKEFLTKTISLETQQFNNALTNSIDDLNKQLEKNTNILKKEVLSNEISRLKSTQELLNIASQAEVRNKQKLLEIVRQINDESLKRDSSTQAEIDKTRKLKELKEKELEDLQEGFKKFNKEKIITELIDFIKIIDDDFNTILFSTAGTLENKIRVNFFELKKDLEKFKIGALNLDDIIGGVDEQKKVFEELKKNFQTLLLPTAPKILDDSLKLFETFENTIKKFDVTSLTIQIKNLGDTLAKLDIEKDLDKTKLVEKIKTLQEEFKKLGEEAGISKEELDKVLDATDKIGATNKFEEKLNKENKLLELQNGLLGALSIELLKIGDNKLDLDRLLRDFFFITENISLEKLLSDDLKRKDINKTAKEFKAFIKKVIENSEFVTEREIVRLGLEFNLDNKLIDTQIKLITKKLQKNLPIDGLTNNIFETFLNTIPFDKLTEFVSKNITLEDLFELDKTNLLVSKLGDLSTENTDLLREYVLLQIERRNKEKEYQDSVDETNKKLDETKKKFESLIKVTFEQATQVGLQLTDSLAGVFQLFIDAAINDFNIAFDNIQAKLDKINEEITKSQARLSESESELRNANGARRRQILEDLDAERVRLAQLQTQKEENERKQEQIDKKRIRAEKESQAIIGVTNTLQQTALAIAAIRAVFTDVTTPSILLKLAAVAATVAAVTSGVGAIKSFRDGGVLEGNSHEQGGIRGTGRFSNVEVEGGEFIVNRKSTEKYFPILDMINKNKFADGGVLPNLNADAGVLSKIAFIEQQLLLSNNRPIYVAVTDINDENNRLTQVTDLSQL